MKSMRADQVSVADDTTTQSRRETLKRFGRYAAVAPTAMMLLQPLESHAGRKAGRKNAFGRKRGRGRDSDY
jgi:hypothetical protein